MLILTLNLILGILLGLYLKDIALLFFIIYILLLLFFKKKKLWTGLILCIILFVITNVYENAYNNLFNGIKECSGIGKIVSYKEEKDYKNKYIIEIKQINAEPKYSKRLIFYADKNIDLSYGDIVYFDGEFSYATEQRNNKGFNYRRYLRQNKIYGILNSNNLRVIKKSNDIITKIQNFKYKLKINLFSRYSEEEAGFLSGLLLGDKKEVSEKIEKDFRDSNLSHVLAISGMHVSYIMIGVDLILEKIIKNRKLRNYILIFFLIFFALFTGGSTSCIRACIMSSLILFSKNIYRKNDFLTSFMLALDIILIINPYNFENIGMWLSFGGTLALSRISTSSSNKLKESLKTSIYVYIVIFPLILYSYNTISLTFFISNFLISFIIGPILILGYVSLIIRPISFIESILLKVLFEIANFVSILPFSKFYLITPNIFYFIIYYANIICINIFKQTKKIIKYVLVILFIFTIILVLINSLSRELEIHFLDVGQGDCTLIITKDNKKILIDGGDRKEEYDYGENVVLPYLLKNGIQSLDYIIISHFDSDHCGGLFYILENIKVDKVVICEQKEESDNFVRFNKIIKQNKIKVITVKKGDELKFENNLKIQILWPEVKNEQIEENALNNNSLVLKLIYKNFSILFTGDIEEAAEKQIIEEYKNTDILKSTILKVAHHGSKTSSTEEIIEKIKPKMVLIGVRRK